MIVRSSSGRISSARFSTAPGLPLPYSLPRSRSASRVRAFSLPAASPVIITTAASFGSRAMPDITLLYWGSSSTKTTLAPLWPRMYSTWSGRFEG